MFALDTVRSICELKQAVETSPGYADVCLKRKYKVPIPPSSSSEEEEDEETDAEEEEEEEEEEVGEEEEEEYVCAPTWSVFDVHGVYDTVGLGDVLRELVDVGRAHRVKGGDGSGGGGGGGGGDGNLTAARALCENAGVVAAANISVGEALCGLGVGCRDGRGGCAYSIPHSSRACVVAGYIDVCEWMAVAAPTEEDMRTLAAVPDHPLDAGGCAGVDGAGVAATLRLGAALVGRCRSSQ